MESELTLEQNDALARFCEFTHINSVETSLQYLQAHDWDVERAIETALITTPDLPPTPEPNQSSTTEERITTTSVVPYSRSNYAVQILRAPLSFLYTFYLKLQPFLPWNVVRAAFTFFQTLFRRKPPKTPLEEIESYVTYFNNRYGANHATLYRGTLSEALQYAQREIRLVFIYLHDKNSVVCDRFCRETLCNEILQSVIADNIFWSTSRDTQEGIKARQLLNINTYPSFCIVTHRGSQQTVEFSLTRFDDPSRCLAEIINGFQIANLSLEYNREQKNRSRSRDRLLEEQNAAYLESMRADQEKAEQRLREENERRQLEEERLEKAREFAEFRDGLKKTLPIEPLSTENDTIQVSIRLPTGESLRRRFRRMDSAKFLFEFPWTNVNVPDRFELLWGYPRKRYQYEQITDETIGDLISGSTETCFLEQIEEDK